MAETARITLGRPDDGHVHLRDGDVLAAAAPLTARRFGRASVKETPDFCQASRAPGDRWVPIRRAGKGILAPLHLLRIRRSGAIASPYTAAK